MERWYTLHTKPNAEYQVTHVLQQRGFQTYLPEIEAANARHKRQKRPFFPCYIFSQVDFELVELSQLQWTPGLRRIVSFGKQPTPLPDEVINSIRRKLGEIEGSGGWPGHSFQPGDTVRIIDGPFSNMLAVFEGPTTPAERVQVLLTILGHASRVQVQVANLEKTPAGVKAPLPCRPRRTRGRINGQADCRRRNSVRARQWNPNDLLRTKQRNSTSRR